MATVNRNLQLRDVEGNLVFPRASLDNIQRSKNDGRNAVIVTLDDSGHISQAVIPSSAEFVCMLRTVGTATPSAPVTGDKYYNITQNKVYTYTGSAWDAGVTPEKTVVYLALDTNNLYRYDGTSSLVDVSTHFSVLQSVATNPYDASVTAVPSEHAVSVALQGKQDRVSGTIPVVVSGDGTISLNYSSGLKITNNNLVADQSYITYTVDSLMLRDAGPADQSTAYVNGGTVYTILGNCELTTSVRTTGAQDTKVPTEAAVRSAINAVVATGGASVIPGRAINVTGGSINVTASTIAQTLGSTASANATTITVITQDDLSAITPKSLHDATSLGQVVDCSLPAKYRGFGTILINGSAVSVDTYMANYLGEYSLKSTSVAAGTEIVWGYYTGSNGNPGFINGHKYLYICDIRRESSTTFERCLFYSTAGSSITGIPSGNTGTTYARIAQVTTNAVMYLAVRLTAAGDMQVGIKNWRQYDVTGLSNDAIAFLAALPEPDLFFRNNSVSNVAGRYAIKHDMVSPYIPITTCTNNSDLVVAPDHAYSLTFTDNNTHKILAAAFPVDAWAHDAFLQLTVKDASKVVFDGINLMSPLRSNSGNNIIIKFRAGQANAYVEDTDVGYIVTLNSGSQNGSLAYGLGNNVGNYIVFSDTTNIT